VAHRLPQIAVFSALVVTLAAALVAGFGILPLVSTPGIGGDLCGASLGLMAYAVAIRMALQRGRDVDRAWATGCAAGVLVGSAGVVIAAGTSAVVS
jgi:hypothetical protein